MHLKLLFKMQIDLRKQVHLSLIWTECITRGLNTYPRLMRMSTTEDILYLCHIKIFHIFLSV